MRERSIWIFTVALVTLTYTGVMWAGDSRPQKDEGLKISCPVGVVCDEHFDYRAYTYQSEKIYIYISFEPQIVNNYSLESFQRYFDYYSIRIYLPERRTENSVSYYAPFLPIEGSPIIDYRDGIITLEFKGVMDEITTRIEDYGDPECRTGDVMGVCYQYEEAEMPYYFHLSLPIE